MSHPELERINARLADEQLKAREETVSNIIELVKTGGDQAITSLSEQLDKYQGELVAQAGGFANLSEDLQEALKRAYIRIEKFHQEELKQGKLDQGWTYKGEYGENLGLRYQAIDSVAIYVPGGQAPLISTVLMTAIPAKVAGVRRIVLFSPPPINDGILAAAELCAIEEIYAIGGAQAIAAAAYGTETIKSVNKIVGPGNIYVSLAKKQVFGKVGIDGIYGPSELAIVADSSASAKQVAADLLSQLEHGSGLESVLLVSNSEDLITNTKHELERQIDALNNPSLAETIRLSLESWSALIQVSDLDEAAQIINDYAPEHLELQLEEAHQFATKIKAAGAIFIGANSCESLGDYLAGPSHCLPTAGSAKFSSGLQVIDFMTKSSIIDFSKAEEIDDLIKDVATIARAEELEAHARAMEARKTNVTL
ncbi:MAG: histidinol dehydrogenase [Candidatus Melainabacteria bacterium]|nr:histidinol dehydrogenase [Candidatus Melainabacteria bacterium]